MCAPCSIDLSASKVSSGVTRRLSRSARRERMKPDAERSPRMISPSSPESEEKYSRQYLRSAETRADVTVTNASATRGSFISRIIFAISSVTALFILSCL